MDRSYYLVNSKRLRIKGLQKIQIIKINYKYIFVDSGKVTSTWGKEPPVMKTRKKFKKEEAREEWKKFIAQGWRRTEEDWTKKSQDC